MSDTDSKSNWSAPMWQAHIARLPTFEERKAALGDVPDDLRDRVLIHLKTVRELKRIAMQKQAKKLKY